MKKINKPYFNITNVVLDAIDNLTNDELKEEIISNIALFQNFEDDFDSKKQTNDLYLISQENTISSNINKEILLKLYNERMLNKTNQARRYYDYIYVSTSNGKCPNCNEREIKTLDHYLPKSKYPILSVSPLNLIPCCIICNKDKLIDYPNSKEEELIHPYYDDIDDSKWLICEITQIKPFKLKFEVDVSIFISQPVLKERLQNHFTAFSLNNLYITHALREFSNIRLYITRLYQNKGSDELKQHLFESYESRFLNDKNSWQTAFYKCLYENDDFCNGLFI